MVGYMGSASRCSFLVATDLDGFAQSVLNIKCHVFCYAYFLFVHLQFLSCKNIYLEAIRHEQRVVV